MTLEKFSSSSRQAITKSQKLTTGYSHEFVEPDHLILALIQNTDGICYKLLERCGVNYQIFLSGVLANLQKLAKVDSGSGQYISSRLQDILNKAQNEAENWKVELVEVDLLFLTLISSTDYKKNINLGELKKAIRFFQSNQMAPVNGENQTPDALKLFGTDLTELAKKGSLEPVIGREKELRHVIQILLRKTKNNPVIIGEAGVGKTAIVEALAQRIASGNVPDGLKHKKIISLQVSALLAGASHKGEFESRFRSVIEEVGNHFGDIILFIDELHTIVHAGKSEGSVDAGNMIKPALARGELKMIGATTPEEYRMNIEKDSALERRFQQVVVPEPTIADTISILRGIKERYEKYHNVRITDEALISASNLSARYLNERKLPDKAIDLIDESAAKIRMQLDFYPEELDDLESQKVNLEVEKGSLMKYLNPNSIPRINQIDNQVNQILDRILGLKNKWDGEKGAFLRLQQINQEIEQINQEMKNPKNNFFKGFGGKDRSEELPALQVEADNLKHFLENSNYIKLEVGPQTVAEVVSKWTNIPVTSLITSEKQKLLHLEDYLHQKIIGQADAVASVSNAIRRSRVGLKDKNRPIGSFIFLGPTGVGKTELSKALASFLFDTDKAIIRFDMSEFMEKHSVSKLIGSPPGYVGYEQGGQLTEIIRRHPYSVVLFDEIEKADPEVFNLLLQVLDEGRLTDSHGRSVNFKNTILILTSNLGSQTILKSIRENQSQDQLRQDIQKILEKNFKPEFLNRIDDTVIFQGLTYDQVKVILEMQIREVDKMLAEQGITMEVSESAKDYLLKLGYSPEFGARPIKRVITRELENRISQAILTDDLGAGKTLHVDFNAASGLFFD